MFIVVCCVLERLLFVVVDCFYLVSGCVVACLCLLIVCLFCWFDVVDFV